MAQDNLLHPQLFTALVSALPEGFLSEMSGALKSIYKESHAAMHGDPLLDEPEAAYCTPHYRRALFETTLRKAALRHGLQATVDSNCRGTSDFTVITAGNFKFTASYLNDRSQRTRWAKFRTNLFELNGMLPQREFDFGLEPRREPDESPIYAIMLHGPSNYDRSEPGFFDIAFPNPAGTSWLAEFSIAELLQATQARRAPAQQDRAFPKLKKKPGAAGQEPS